MVARAGTHQRIDIALHAIESALDDLPDIEDEWNELPDGERASWSLDWDHLMGSYLPRLEESCQSQLMDDVQARRYAVLRTRLGVAFPCIERLNLYRPRIALD